MRNTTELFSHHVTFDGALLCRGFWLYVFNIINKTERFIYIGMTGDRSSGHAGSPFDRMSKHLGRNPRNNAIRKKLEKMHINPEECSFEVMAIGPLFDEQKPASNSHTLFCDQVEALERALAEHLKEQLYKVISHHRSFTHTPDPQVLKDVIKLAERHLSEIRQSPAR